VSPLPPPWASPRELIPLSLPFTVIALAASILFAAWRLDEHYITRTEFHLAIEGLERQIDNLAMIERDRARP